MRKIDIHEMIERDTAEAAMPTNPTDDVIEMAERWVRAEYPNSSVVYLVQRLIEVARSAREDTRRLDVLQAELDVRRLVVTYEHRIGERIPQGRLRTLADMLLEGFVGDAAIAAEEG